MHFCFLLPKVLAAKYEKDIVLTFALYKNGPKYCGKSFRTALQYTTAGGHLYLGASLVDNLLASHAESWTTV